jgi:hypothetical protein
MTNEIHYSVLHMRARFILIFLSSKSNLVFVFTNKMARSVGPDSPAIFAVLQWSSKSSSWLILFVLDLHWTMLAGGMSVYKPHGCSDHVESSRQGSARSRIMHGVTKLRVTQGWGQPSRTTGSSIHSTCMTWRSNAASSIIHTTPVKRTYLSCSYVKSSTQSTYPD